MYNQKEEFLRLANKIKSFGFCVYVAKDDKNNYGFFTDDKEQRVVYFQLKSFSCLPYFSIKIKPSKKYGCGRIIDEKKDFFIDSLTKELLQSFLQAEDYGEIKHETLDSYLDNNPNMYKLFVK